MAWDKTRVRDWRGSSAVPQEWSGSETPESPTVLRGT